MATKDNMRDSSDARNIKHANDSQPRRVEGFVPIGDVFARIVRELGRKQ